MRGGLPRILNQLIKRRDFWMPFAPAILASRQHHYIDNPKKLRSPQIVPDDQDCGIRDILRCFTASTGRAALLNTSLNLHGEPIARTAADAVPILRQSGLTCLQLGPYLVRKNR